VHKHVRQCSAIRIQLFTITRVHVCTCISIITICMPIRPNSDVGVLRHWQMYNQSEVVPKALKAYIEMNLANSVIQRSPSPAVVKILFATKKDGGLRLVVEYQTLNIHTVKNRYPLPLILKMLDRVHRDMIFTRLNLRNAYHLICIKEGNEYKTTFRTRYSQFKYWVMPI